MIFSKPQTLKIHAEIQKIMTIKIAMKPETMLSGFLPSNIIPKL